MASAASVDGGVLWVTVECLEQGCCDLFRVGRPTGNSGAARDRARARQRQLGVVDVGFEDSYQRFAWLILAVIRRMPAAVTGDVVEDDDS
jgi:hypothetical protein